MLQAHVYPPRIHETARRATPGALVRALSLHCAALALAFSASFPAHGFSSAPYLPLVDGTYWSYQLDGGPTYATQVQSGPLVNGYPTHALYDSEDASFSYISNDALGIRQHQYFDPLEDFGVCTSSYTETYISPIVLATPDVTLGQVIPGSGTVNVSVPGCGFFDTYSYQSSSSIVNFETVTVPLGSFSVVRVQVSNSLFDGVTFLGSIFNTYWLARDIGPIQSTYQQDAGPVYTYRLAATNIVRTAPDAFSFPPQTGVALNSTATSSAITVTGTTAASPISITGGQYSINGGAFTSAAGTVTNGQTVTVRQTSSASPSTTTNATLTIGGVSGTFSVTTTSVPSYLLTVQVSGAGAVTSNVGGINCGATCTANYVAGTMVTLTATVTAAGSIFSGWSGGGCSGTGTCTVTMDAAKTVSATFVPNTLTIVKVGNGTVSGTQTSSPILIDCGPACSPSIREGGTVTLSATPDPSYVFTGWSGAGCSGTGTCIIVMNAPTTVTATFTFVDTQPPAAPAGLIANAVSGSQINLLWSASSDNVGVSAYQVFRGGVFQATVTGATSFGDTGLAAITLYSYTVAACDAAGNCSPQSSTASATTLAAGQYYFEPVLPAGFTLLGNALELTLDVAALFGNQDPDMQVDGVTAYVESVWKWNSVQDRWAFYSPKLTSAGTAAYAASRGYEVLATINPGEGYWVKATQPVTLPAQSGTAYPWNGFSFSALPSGFNLISDAGGVAPDEFNLQVTEPKPAEGVVPTTNFRSLWAWDAAAGKWFFYAPILDASGGLDAVKTYTESHNLLHFQDYGKLLGLGTGFWVNRP